MRVVLDTNIFISGIHWKGPSEKILHQWISGRLQLITSHPIIEELKKTLTQFKIPLQTEEINKWEALIRKNSTIAHPTQKIDLIKEDPDDNKFVEAAIAGTAEYIISQDKHLLKIKKYKNIEIIHPEEFLKRIR